MKKNIRKERHFPFTPDQVWLALTESEQISSWLMPTQDFKAVKGHKFMLQAKPMGKWDGKIYGEILTAERPERLSYTWKGDQMKSNTILTWTLSTTNKGTLLVLEHTGFEGFGDVILGIFHAMGWNRFLNQLEQLIKSRAL